MTGRLSLLSILDIDELTVREEDRWQNTCGNDNKGGLEG
jgi:hypothetical protein